MLYAVVVYILSEPIGLRMGLTTMTFATAAVISIGILWVFWTSGKKQKEQVDPDGELLNDQLPIGTFSTENA